MPESTEGGSPAKSAGESQQKLIAMARVIGPWGVKGWIKLLPHTAEIDMLCGHPVWWAGRNGDWREVRVTATEQKGNYLVAQIDGIVVPEEAVKLKGMDVALPRSALPASGENEFYKVDLVGMDVANEEGGALGRVVELYSNGAHDVLRVEAKDDGRERLIPFVPAVVRQVDMAGGVIHVAWGLDW